MVEGNDADRRLQFPIPRCASAARPRPGHKSAKPSPKGRGSPTDCRRLRDEWRDQSKCRKSCRRCRRRSCSGSRRGVVFLCLAALYESWTIRWRCLLTVAASGSAARCLAETLRGCPTGRLFHRRLIHIIGLADQRPITHSSNSQRGSERAGQTLSRKRSKRCSLRSARTDDGFACVCGCFDCDRDRRRRRQPAGARTSVMGGHDRSVDPGAG